MECRYCRAWNDDDEHRCNRCGRRLHASVARPAPDTYPISTATAPALADLARAVSREEISAVTATPPAAQRSAYQRQLFQESGRVVEIPVSSSSVAVAVAEPREYREPVRNKRPRRQIEGQQNLKFDELDVPVETMIYCDAPVALPAHRAMATALDASMIVMGLGLFLLTFHFAGGDIVLNRQTIPLFVGITAVLALFYHFLFCISGGDTAGMMWTHLRLVNFDGQIPDREQRVFRLVGSCLSMAAAGLGLVWALVDEESLTWHDHISKTFPSPR